MRTTEERRRAMLWVAAAASTAATFSPAVLPADRVEPTVAGMPYALWAGLVVALLYVGLTAAATRLYRDDDAPPKGDRQRGFKHGSTCSAAFTWLCWRWRRTRRGDAIAQPTNSCSPAAASACGSAF